jgi:hypothetical protein
MKNNPSAPNPTRTRRQKTPRRDDLDNHPVETSPQALLRDEIAMLKEMAIMVETMAGNDLSPSDLVRLVDVRGKTSTRIAALLKTERLFNENGGTMDAFKQALDEVILELEKGEGASGAKLGGGKQ